MNDGNDFKLVAEADPTNMSAFICKASRELQEKIMEHEEQLVLTAVSDSGLNRLIALCQNELNRRKIPEGNL